MYSKVKICNLALTAGLGANPITSFTEGTKEADLCNDLFDLLRDMLLAAHPWDFAKKWVSLAEDASYTIMDARYSYAYAPPSDYIRPVRGETRPINFERRGAVLLSNDSPLKLEYIYRIEDTTLYPIYFVNALAALIRANVAGPLAKKGAKTTNWWNLYGIVFEQAKALDGQESKPTAEENHGHTDDTDTFLSSRA